MLLLAALLTVLAPAPAGAEPPGRAGPYRVKDAPEPAPRAKRPPALRPRDAGRPPHAGTRPRPERIDRDRGDRTPRAASPDRTPRADAPDRKARADTPDRSPRAYREPPSYAESLGDSPIDPWPWILRGAVLAVIAVLYARWRRDEAVTPESLLNAERAEEYVPRFRRAYASPPRRLKQHGSEALPAQPERISILNAGGEALPLGEPPAAPLPLAVPPPLPLPLPVPRHGTRPAIRIAPDVPTPGAPQPAPAKDAPTDTPAAATPGAPSASSKSASGKRRLRRSRRPQRLRLPDPYDRHFQALPGEVIRWRTTFGEPLHVRGDIAFTSARILAVYARTSFTIFPPRIVVETKRHQCAHAQVTMYRATKSRRVILLLAAAPLAMLFPLGTVAAVLAVAAYAAAPRTELTLWSGGQRRSFPLRPIDIDSALKTLETLGLRRDPPAAARSAALNDTA